MEFSHIGIFCLGLTWLAQYHQRNTAKKIRPSSDADWAGNINDRKSTSGYLFKICGAAVSWRRSTAQEATWLRQLTKKLQSGSAEPTVIYEDNQSLISLPRILSSMAEQNTLTSNTTLSMRSC